MSANPLLDFVSKAVPTGRKLKILLYGASGSGKTRAALTFPRPLLVDAEGGSAFYRGRTGIGEFLVKDTKSLTDLEKVISLVQQDNGKSVDTLIIDPITVFYDVQKDAMARTAKDGALGFREWARINNRMKSLYNSLTNLPVHVIVIARESVEYEGEGNNLKKIGQKPDSDKALPYVFDFSIRMNADHTGTVIKSRGLELAKNNRLEAVNWTVFQPAVENTSGGKQLVVASDEDAIESEATILKIEQPALSIVERPTNGTPPPAPNGDVPKNPTPSENKWCSKETIAQFGIDVRDATGVRDMTPPDVARLGLGDSTKFYSYAMWNKAYTTQALAIDAIKIAFETEMTAKPATPTSEPVSENEMLFPPPTDLAKIGF